MATTADDVDLATADERLTAELCRQLALGHDCVTLGALARETRLSQRRVEEVMGNYEQGQNAIQRAGGTGDDIRWRLRERE